MKYRLLGIVILAFVVMLSANSREADDGYRWQSLSPDFKVGYMDGYATAIGAAGVTAMTNCLHNLTPQQITEQSETEKCLNISKSADFNGGTLGDYVNAVDRFYRDQRNRDLPMRIAIEYVRGELRGETQAELSKYLYEWRKAKAELEHEK